ncbi:hypothetical protein YC2023_066731 [Brassica napus]
MFIHQEVWVSIPENCGIMRIKGKRLTRDLQHGIMSTIKYGFHRVTQVMQLNVNFHTAEKNNTQDHTPFSNEPSSERRKLSTSIFQQAEATEEHESRRQTRNHTYSKAARKTPSKSVTSNLKLLKDVRHVLLTTQHHDTPSQIPYTVARQR